MSIAWRTRTMGSEPLETTGSASQLIMSGLSLTEMETTHSVVMAVESMWLPSEVYPHFQKGQRGLLPSQSSDVLSSTGSEKYWITPADQYRLCKDLCATNLDPTSCR